MSESQDSPSSTSSQASGDERCEPLSVGQHLGRYIILAPIGKGGMGAVYEAYDPDLDRRIALKIVKFRQTEDEAAVRARDRLMREAQALAQLNHPNVVAVHDVGVCPEGVFIAMELVNGTTLRRFLKENRPARSEILRLIREAGNGLAAAHRAGIVHRDFKPENVVIGQDGRVRVLDFGLARTAGRSEAIADTSESKDRIESPMGSEVDSEGAQPSPSEESFLRKNITRVGAQAGTPGYMASEQLLCQEVDARTDQFAFAVVLWEALYGRRPFTASSRSKLAKKVIMGRIDPPPDGVKVPAWIVRVLTQALEPNPDRRYPDLKALLEDLDRDPTRRLRRGLVGLAILVLVGLTAALAWSAATSAHRLCQDGPARIAGIWGPAAREAVADAFRSSGRPHAPRTLESVTHSLNEYTGAWARQYAEACEATQVRGEQSQALLDLRMRCLRSRLNQVAALVGAFRDRPEPELIDKALQATASLPPLEACTDEEALVEPVPPPADPERRARADALGDQLDQVIALTLLGKPGPGLTLARKVAAEAEQLGHAPLTAAAFFQQAVLESQNGNTEQAQAILRSALPKAVDAKDDAMIARIWIELLWNQGYREARFDEALRLKLPVEMAVRRAKGDFPSAYRFHNVLGVILWQKGQYDEAIAELSRAIDLQTEHNAGDEMPLATALTNLGLVYNEKGESRRAIAFHTRALEIERRLLGPDHPSTANTCNNIGIAYLDLGDFKLAIEQFESALSVYLRTYGPAHPHIGVCLNNLGLARLHLGKLDQARESLERALQVREAALGPEHRLVATTLDNLGQVFLELGQLDRAREVTERALAMRRRLLGPAHIDIARSLHNLGRISSERHDQATARRTFAEALETMHAAQLDEHPQVANILVGLGKISHAQEARRLFERAVALCQRVACEDESLSAALFGQATSLWGNRDRRREALELARRALAAHPSGPSELRQEIEAWIGSRETR